MTGGQLIDGPLVYFQFQKYQSISRSENNLIRDKVRPCWFLMDVFHIQ